MPFKSEKQRRGFFGNRVNMTGNLTPQMVRQAKNSNFIQLQKKGIRLSKTGDFDKDGVPNAKDCRPLNPKKQGRLHDLAVKTLKKKEEFIEKRREKRMKKLNDLADKLRERQATLAARNKVQAQKLAVIKEIKREKDQIQELKDANKQAKKELFRSSKFGKVAIGAGKAAKVTGRGFKAIGKGAFKGAKATPAAVRKSKKALKKTEKFLNKILG